MTSRLPKFLLSGLFTCNVCFDNYLIIINNNNNNNFKKIYKRPFSTRCGILYYGVHGVPERMSLTAKRFDRNILSTSERY